MSDVTFPPPAELVPGDGELRATVRTTMGAFTVRLLEDIAPNTVANFVGLATGAGAWTDPRTGDPGQGALYDGVAFHRVISDFAIQAGDPTGTGLGGPGYRIADECDPRARHDRPGMVSMASRKPGDNGSQFFVTLDAASHLDGRHTVFGEVVDGLDTVRRIGRLATDRSDRPAHNVTIETVEVSRC